MMIHEEIGDGYYCILVDEAQDTSKREQMAISLRFVNPKEANVIWESISHLDNIINIITSFHKRVIGLQSAQRNEIEHMLATGECESGRGANQVGVRKFCSKHDIEIPNQESLYKVGPCRPRDQITTEHHYHFDVFNEAIDFILIKLNTRFNDTSVELLTLGAALDPKNSFKSFSIHDSIMGICESKIFVLWNISCDIFELDMKSESQFQVSTLVELYQRLTKSGKSGTHIMVTQLIRLVLTLSVSIATTE
ncbi:uncharacterized protein LOC111370072 [Olea europaea var. sylvestris]|uniref:uncharacterized protein LOC111370072 n=1 Tax=Olea europaea var. sylvestris TaxID=158386 RepID=UPI000C1D1FA4|nr:uncharacterized protein LOC111370072 [Olea europaea var. sylvestris]